MGSTPFFSIVIPTYNRMKFIGKTIESVLAQRFKDFEVVIVNDGGTDNTKDLVSGYSDPRIKYYETDNKERGAARNFGIKMALGMYATFLDSDDLLKENHLDVAFDYINSNKSHAPVLFSMGYEVISTDGNVITPWKPLPHIVNDKLSEGNFLSCIGVFIPREVLLENPFNEDRNLAGSEDYELWLRIAAKYPIYSLPYVTSSMVNHDERSVLNFSPDKLIVRRKLLKEYLWRDHDVQKKYGPVKRKVEAYMDLYVALHLAIGSYRLKGLKKLIQAFFQYPWLMTNYRFWVVIKKILLF
jgi:glycosyltransferase involved in cell wall biosynthesis